jgi:galactokinase
MNAKAIEVKQEFVAIFQQQPLLVSSPGRVNIIGEHTDYNDGFVLPAAINKSAYFAISLRADNEIHLIAKDLNETYQTSISNIKPDTKCNWPNYILGSIAQFIKKGVTLKGFNVLFTSDIPIGAGLSSSAAIECATVYALNELLQTNFDRVTMVKMAQAAEQEFTGVMCGIMDQFASMMGKKDHVIQLDCRSLEFQYVPFKLEGIKILLLNTNVKHALANSEYNTRRKECNQAVEWIKEHENNIHSLRDVTLPMINEYVRPKNQLVANRSEFIVEEIQRLLDACNDLYHDNINELGKKMFETHRGLSELYEVSCKELDWLVNFVKHNNNVLGARMMGGGFGGCTINLVKEHAIDDLVDSIKINYEKQMGLPLSYYVATIEDGTHIITE